MGNDISSGSLCSDFCSTNIVQPIMLPIDPRQQPVTKLEPMSLPLNHLSYLEPHISKHSSGLAQATSFGNKALAAIPGNTMIQRGSNFK